MLSSFFFNTKTHHIVWNRLVWLYFKKYIRWKLREVDVRCKIYCSFYTFSTFSDIGQIRSDMKKVFFQPTQKELWEIWSRQLREFFPSIKMNKNSGHFLTAPVVYLEWIFYQSKKVTYSQSPISGAWLSIMRKFLIW